MNTVDETEANMRVSRQKIMVLANDVNSMATLVLDRMSILGTGRVVCSKRARKLRRKGYDVQFLNKTYTGKARYMWARRPAWSV